VASPDDQPATTEPTDGDAIARPAKKPSPTKATGKRATLARRKASAADATRASAGQAPYCPYCALVLDPPPEANRRCSRCRQRIVVKRIDGRVVYLTEASLAIFDAERTRAAKANRSTLELDRWLKAAATAHAPAERVERLRATPISEGRIAAARALYVTTVDNRFRAAKRERRWKDASRIMRDHAAVLFRAAGSAVPPPVEALQAHRQGAAAALRGIGEVAKHAELRNGTCCDACRADDGRTFRVAEELRAARLPHGGCPKGLCRCDWYLQDQSLVRRHVRRRPGVEAPPTTGV
jgi:hypothetical protein